MSTRDDTSSTDEQDAAGTARDRPFLQVGEVADRVRLSHRTVRYYDDQGLLSAVRSAGNYRLYSEADVARLLLIRRMKPLGFTLEEMRDLLDVVDTIDGAEVTPPDTDATLRAMIDDVRQRRDRLAEQLTTADEFLESLRRRLA